MDDRAAIEQTIETWTQARIVRDWDGLLAMCTDDLVLSPPGEPRVSGDDIRPWLEHLPPIDTLKLDTEHCHVAGDRATVIGSGGWTARIEGQLIRMDFKFIGLFRKQAGGAWVFSDVIWNLNHPMP